VFVHLVDRTGTIVAQSDSQPRKGQLPMSTWEPHKLVTDVILLPIDASVPVGNDYQLVIGIYDAHTGARVSPQDSQGRPLGDAITISSFKVVE